MKQQKNGRDSSDKILLDDFFQTEKSPGPQPSARLLEAVLNDAKLLQPAPRFPVSSRAKTHERKLGLWPGFGGWQVAAALSLCLVVGLSVGFSAPDRFGNIANIIFSESALDGGDGSYYSLDDLMVEG
jgi:hypothetical protein